MIDTAKAFNDAMVLGEVALGHGLFLQAVWMMKTEEWWEDEPMYGDDSTIYLTTDDGQAIRISNPEELAQQLGL